MSKVLADNIAPIAELLGLTYASDVLVSLENANAPAIATDPSLVFALPSVRSCGVLSFLVEPPELAFAVVVIALSLSAVTAMLEAEIDCLLKLSM